MWVFQLLRNILNLYLHTVHTFSAILGHWSIFPLHDFKEFYFDKFLTIYHSYSIVSNNPHLFFTICVLHIP